MRLVRVPRLPDLPRSAVIALAAVVAVVGLNELLGRWSGAGGVTLCAVQRLTNRPCPGCGGTRAVVALLSGDIGAALQLNPLVCVLAAVAVALLVLRLGFGRALRLGLTPRDRVFALAGLLLAVAANWAYLLTRPA